MSFLSFNFWLVFPIIFGLYWLIPVKFNLARKVFLILVSYLLYMNWKPAFAIVLLGVTLITYFGGYLLDKNKIERSRKSIAILFAILSLLPLIVFKYYNFLNSNYLFFSFFFIIFGNPIYILGIENCHWSLNIKAND